GEPVLRHLWIEGGVGILRIRVAIEVPARIDEGVHRVGFAARRTAAFGAGGVYKFRHAAERRAALLRDLNLRRKDNRQLVVGDWDEAVAFAVDHGDGCAPIALATYTPVLQAERDRSFAKRAACGNLLHPLLCFSAAWAVVFAGVDQDAFFGEEGQFHRRVLAGGPNHLDDWQAIFGGEFKVSFIVTRNAHDGAGTVVGQDVVGHPYRYALAVVRIHGKAPGGNTMLLDSTQVAGFARLLLLVK